jgi:hypothetical protein
MTATFTGIPVATDNMDKYAYQKALDKMFLGDSIKYARKS